MNDNSITDIRHHLEAQGISLKKRFGQNFLIDAAVRRRIAETIMAEMAARESAAGEVWEVGPGLGALTEELLLREVKLRLFEIDRGIIRHLRDRYGDKLPIVEGDFIKTFPEYVAAVADDAAPCPRAIVGNLPYHSASAMIADIVESAIPVPCMVFLVQTELAQRLGAVPGTKDYSALTVLVQSHFTVEQRFAVPAGAFYPRPRVGSSVVVMAQQAERPRKDLTGETSRIARQAFSQRRKTLRNTLRDEVALLDALGIDPGKRPEELSPAQFRSLAAASLTRRSLK